MSLRVSFEPEDLRIEGNPFPSTLRSHFVPSALTHTGARLGSARQDRRRG
jgi:hypothetical protein